MAKEIANAGHGHGIIDPVNYDVPAIVNPQADEFGQMTQALYLPRLQLEGSSSKLVKNDKVAKGTYVVHTGKDEYQELGARIDVLVLGYRSKALDMTDQKSVIAAYNKDSKEFKRIHSAAMAKTKSMMVGLEFLLWLPSMSGDKKFATLFMGSPTSRRAAANFAPMVKIKPGDEKNVLKRQATLGWEKLSTTEYIWEGITIIACSVPLKNYPEPQAWADSLNSFYDTPEDIVIETVPEDQKVDATAGDRDR